MVFPLGCVSVFDDAYPPTKCFIGAAKKKKKEKLVSIIVAKLLKVFC